MQTNLLQNAPAKILIGFPGTMADTIQATSLLQMLKNHFQKSRIDFLLPTLHAPVLDDNPNLDEIIRFPEAATFANLFSMMRRMREREYELSIDLAGTLATKFLFYLAHQNYRLNCASRKRDHENPLQHRFQPLSEFGLCKDNWPSPVVSLSADERDWATTYLISGGMHLDKPIVAIQPWRLWTQKVFSNDDFVRLAESLLERGYQVILTQSINQAPVLQEIMDRLPRQIICIRNLELRRLAAVLSSARLLISDTRGPTDLAVATGVPVLCICKDESEKARFTYRAYSPHKAVTHTSIEDILRLVDEMT